MPDETWLTRERQSKYHPAQRLPLILPERFRQAEPALIPHVDMRHVVQRYCRDFEQYASKGRAPSFFGRAETYKTYAAAVVVRWVAEREQLEAEFVDAGTEFLRLENRRFDRESGERLDRLGSVAFLVLDDITNVLPKSHAEAMMTNVVNQRFQNLRPTCFTGNFRLDTDMRLFAERYNPSLARRIYRGSKDLLVVTG